MKIEYVDDPPGRTPKPIHQADERVFAAALKERPERWAKYPLEIASYSAARTLASRITNGKKHSFGKGFVATQRQGEVFVKYIGGD